MRLQTPHMGVRFECLIFGQFSFSHQKIVSYLPPFVLAYHQFAVQICKVICGTFVCTAFPSHNKKQFNIYQ